MSDMVQTSFRMHRTLIAKMDFLVENAPQELNECGPRPVRDRTDLLERLVFLAYGKAKGNANATPPASVKTETPAAKKRSRK